MTDRETQGLLERATIDLEPSRGLEEMRTMARRRQSKGRFVAAGTAILVAVAGVGGTIGLLRRAQDLPPTPAASVSAQTPTDEPSGGQVGALQKIWSVEVPGSSFASTVISDGERLYVTTPDGMVAYPIDCADPCSPLWRASVGDERDLLGPEIAAGDGVVVLTVRTRGLYVFSPSCASDGSVCEPTWLIPPPEGTNGFVAPLVANGVIKVAVSTGTMPDDRVEMRGYPVDCQAACAPLWRGDLGIGTLFAPGVAVDGVFYEQVGLTMTGYAASCRSDGAMCEPDFLMQDTGGDPHSQSSSVYGPVAQGGELVFSVGAGNVYAFGEHCGTTCNTRWYGVVGNFLEGAPLLAGNEVVVSGGDSISAFPLGCRADGDACEATWRVNLGSNSIIEQADAAHVFVTSGRQDNRVVSIIPTECGDPCEPIWTTTPIHGLSGVAADDGSMYAGFGGDDLAAYPLDCADPCSASATAKVGGESFWILPGNRGIAVGARSGESSDARFRLTMLVAP